ncbi:MAG: class I SAM-dependent methyltransferase [Muribaculaceae bacterium]|nr:class I SAM-dependent methyltransferase [Muribaculaceae bacterium]
MNKNEIDFFDRISESWDADEILSTPDRIRSILGKLEIMPGMNILDLGTGTGVLVPYLHALTAPDGNVTAVDISHGMLSKAIAKYGDLQRVKFVESDFETSEVVGTFDLILLYSVYPHLHEPEKTLKKIGQNLNRGGRIVIAFPTDENFINGIHRERKAESDLLPPAHALAARIESWGMKAKVTEATANEYIVEISLGN